MSTATADEKPPPTLVIHRTSPQGEIKAVHEVRDNGGKALMPPMEKRWRKSGGKGYLVPVARGYIATQDQMATGTYVKKMVGRAQRADVRQLYHTARDLRRGVRSATRKAQEVPTFEPGQSVIIADGGSFDGHPAEVIETRGRVVRVNVKLFGTYTPLSCSVFKVRCATVTKKAQRKSNR